MSLTATFQGSVSATSDAPPQLIVTLDVPEGAVMGLRLHLMAGEEELNLSGCSVDISLAANLKSLFSEIAITDITKGFSVSAEEDIKGNLDPSGESATEFSMTQANGEILLLGIFESANPSYTLQHYLWFPHVKKSASEDIVPKKTVEFVDTSMNLYGSKEEHDTIHGGTLPQNGQTKAVLKNAGRIFQVDLVDGTGALTTEMNLVRLFSDEPTDYATDPQISYMDRIYSTLADSTSCSLSQVWVYEPKLGADGEIEDPYVDADGNLIDENIPNSMFAVFRVPGQTVDVDDGSGPAADAERDAGLIRFTNNKANPHLTIPSDNWDDALAGLDERYFIAGSGTNQGLAVVRWDAQNPDLSEYKYAYTILIRKGTVIRFVFESSEGERERAANFFDYNIGDGQVYTSLANAQAQKSGHPSSYAAENYSTKLWINTDHQGINSLSNYSGNGAKPAFGNDNTYTGLGNESWNNNTFNKANKNGNTYNLCTFGLVTSMTEGEDGMPRVVWSEGIDSVNWFGTEGVGKTVYPASSANYNLGFLRQGNTYTLNGVSHGGVAVETDLGTFQNTANNIMSNEFWPMDDVGSTDGHDFLFGSYGNAANRRSAGANGANSQMPTSDGTYGGTTKPGTQTGKKHDHNSYFGMSFSVNFTLAPGYIAPLEYWFYGDDDLWVFLDKPGDPSFSPRLVADIGGVHSSVGEYVDLWDYIEPVPMSADDSVTYRLTIFYTERGASGSTCYMRFSVPMDAPEVPPQVRDEAVVIEKQLLDDAGNLIDTEEKPNNPDRIIFEGLKSNEWPEDMNTIEQDIASGSLKMAEGYFLFRISLHNASGIPYQDIYDYAIYDRSQVPNHAEDIDHDKCVIWGTIGDRSTTDGAYYFALKSDEYIVISSLPDGTWYEVKEISNQNYVTGWQKGTHTHEGNRQIDKLENMTIYRSDTGLDNSFDARVTNFVRFTNSPALKIVANPDDDRTVLVGDIVEYNIYRTNVSGIDQVIIRDRLDPGVDFVGAKFGESSADDAAWWLPSAEALAGGQILETTMQLSGGVTGTMRYDPEYSYDAANHPEDSAETQAFLEERYKEPSPTVIWELHGDVENADAAVSLRVQVNNKAGQTEDGASDIENQAIVQSGNDSFIVTNKTETPSWAPEKTEAKVDHTANAELFDPVTEETPDMSEIEGGVLGPFVMPGDIITYRITWKNYLEEAAKVTVRDPLDENLRYVDGTAKSYRYESYDADGLPVGEAVLIGDGSLIENAIVWEMEEQESGIQGYVEFNAEVLPGATKQGFVWNGAFVQVGEEQELETGRVRNDTAEDPHKTEVSPGAGIGVQVGDIIEYKITYRNWSDKASKITLTDTLEEGLDVLEESLNGGVYDTASRTITWTFDNVPAGESGEVTFQARVNENARTKERVENNAGMILGSHDAQESESVENPLDEPHKEADPKEGTQVRQGQKITYTLTAKNTRDFSIDIDIWDRLDMRLNFVSASDGGTYDPASREVRWHFVDVPPGEMKTVTLTVTVSKDAMLEVENTGYAEFDHQPAVETERLVHPLREPMPLPDTGGPGTDMLVEISSLACAAGALILKKNRRKKI